VTARYQHAIVACARWESEYLAEWLVYHRQVGFDHAYIYCNDDDPAECYERLLPFIVGPDPFVSFVYFPFVGLQGEMYKHFLRTHLYETGWFIFLDVDEFIVFRQEGTVANFLAKRLDHADMIFLNWLVFGHSGFKVRPRGSVLLNYTMRANTVHHYTKVLTRAQALDARRYIEEPQSGFWHSWNFRDEELKRVVNVIGDDMSGYYAADSKSGRAYLDQGDRQQRIIATAVIHHYQFRSEDEISRRLSRGTAGDFRGQLAFKRVLDDNTVAEFLSQFSVVRDNSLRDYWRYVLNLARDSTVLVRPTAPNIAFGKPANQSSISPWSRGATTKEDAGLVVGGTFTGTYNCHTGEDNEPWWQVDLLEVHDIRQIQIFNRVDTQTFRQRASCFSLEASTDGKQWTILYRTSEPLLFGGVDGHPLIWRNQTPCAARYVRLRLLNRTLLHIDAVEIYLEAHQVLRAEPSDYGPLTDRIVRYQTHNPPEY
jgi:hypothetical protein